MLHTGKHCLIANSNVKFLPSAVEIEFILLQCLAEFANLPLVKVLKLLFVKLRTFTNTSMFLRLMVASRLVIVNHTIIAVANKLMLSRTLSKIVFCKQMSFS